MNPNSTDETPRPEPPLPWWQRALRWARRWVGALGSPCAHCPGDLDLKALNDALLKQAGELRAEVEGLRHERDLLRTALDDLASVARTPPAEVVEAPSAAVAVQPPPKPRPLPPCMRAGIDPDTGRPILVNPDSFRVGRRDSRPAPTNQELEARWGITRPEVGA